MAGIENAVIQSLITGISQALYEQFGEGYTIYAEDVEQDLQQPCFFIQLLSASERRHLSGRFLRSQTIAVTFLPAVDSRMALYPVSEQLDACLEVITVDGGQVRARNQHSEISDGVLVYTADYDFRIVKEMNQEERMEELKTEGRVEHGKK